MRRYLGEGLANEYLYHDSVMLRKRSKRLVKLVFRNLFLVLMSWFVLKYPRGCCIRVED